MLLEEALSVDIPVIALDPTGDLADPTLAFPSLSAPEPGPWVDEAIAERRGMTPDATAGLFLDRADVRVERLARCWVVVA